MFRQIKFVTDRTLTNCALRVDHKSMTRKLSAREARAVSLLSYDMVNICGPYAWATYMGGCKVVLLGGTFYLDQTPKGSIYHISICLDCCCIEYLCIHNGYIDIIKQVKNDLLTINY